LWNFDLKAMGYQERVAAEFRQRLQEQLLALRVTIDGPMDVAVKEIEYGSRRWDYQPPLACP